MLKLAAVCKPSPNYNCILSILSIYNVFLSGFECLILSNISLEILHVFLHEIVGFKESKTQGLKWKKSRIEVESNWKRGGEETSLV